MKIEIYGILDKNIKNRITFNYTLKKYTYVIFICIHILKDILFRII